MMKLLIPVLSLLLLLAACGTKPADNSNASGGQTPKQDSNQNPALAEQNKAKPWKTPPAMSIDPNKKYKAVVATSKGTFSMELFAKEAPKTVNNFVFLAKEGFYNDIVFHRIIKSFMIQTGDPKGNGSGGPGYTFEDELKTPYKYEPGIVAMANSGKNTNGSQFFFICTGDDSKNLNRKPDYTIFGKIVDGMDTVQAIASTPVAQGGESVPSKPIEKVTIQSISIQESQ